MANETRDPDTINVNRAFQTAWIVYINGLEVPVSSVSITSGVWEIPQAEIVMVPDPTILRFGAEDRVTVQVFYCDQWINPAKPEFRLCFDGEIVAWNYVNVNKNRTISFTAIDYIQIFTQIFFFFMSSIDDMAVGATGALLGVDASGVKLAGLGALFPYSLFAQGLTQQTPTAEDGSIALIKRPIEYVYNLVDGMTLANIPNRSLPVANFFAPWAQRTNFNKRFLALPKLEDSDKPGIFPILRAVQADFAVSAVAQLTSNIGTAGAVYDVFKEVLSTLMMEIAMIPTPAAVQSDYKTLDIMGPPQADSPTFLGNYFVKPQFLFGLPPSCNVFFPSQISYFGYQENYATQPTRLYFNAESWLSYLNVKNASPGLQQTVRAALTVAHPEEVHQALVAALADKKTTQNGKNVLAYPDEFFRGPVVDKRSMPRWFMFLSKAQGGYDAANLNDVQEEQLAREILPGDSERNIYRKYAAYEFTKEKYSRRNGAIMMAFNPYPVPGFPCAAFDRRSSQVDIFGYIMNVRQTLSTREMSTTVSYSYGRTFQEAFALLRRQIDLENAVIENNKSTASQVDDSPADLLNMERIGAIAIAPAEPLVEVRDEIQNFVRAENFYKSLFYRVKAPSADTVTQNQLQTELTRTPDAGVANISATPIKAYASDSSQVAKDVGQKDASFQYYKIIDFVTDEGKKEGIQLSGIDATTRIRIVNILDKMRTKSASEEEVDLVRRSLNRPELEQPVEVTFDLSGSTDTYSTRIAQINQAEEFVQNLQTTTNLSGDRQVAPTTAAQGYFESYEAAMLYNARPICTLDEYIKFLGTHAVVEGKVVPGRALTTEDPRTFPAVYYKRIRKYRPGPPAVLPEGLSQLTNAGVISSPNGATATLSEAPTATLQALPADFPQTSQDWDKVLFAYRSNVLAKLAPGR